MKKLEYLIVAILALLCIYTAWRAYTLKEKIEYITDTVTITDTITNLDTDTIFFSRYDTAYMTIVDTVNDTVTKIDSILVQIPISTSIYDTTITDTNYETNLRAVLSGFNTSMDSLYLTTKIMHQEAGNGANRWYHNLAPALGFGYGTGGWGIFVGVGYTLK